MQTVAQCQYDEILIIDKSSKQYLEGNLVCIIRRAYTILRCSGQQWSSGRLTPREEKSTYQSKCLLMTAIRMFTNNINDILNELHRV